MSATDKEKNTTESDKPEAAQDIETGSILELKTLKFLYGVGGTRDDQRDIDCVDFAAKPGWMDIGRTIPKQYLDLELPNRPDNFTQVEIACVNGCLDIVQQMTGSSDPGSSTEPANDVGARKAVLHYVCANGYLRILEYIIEKCKIDPTKCIDECTGVTLLHDACRGGHLDIIKFLIKLGCDPAYCCRYGSQPLHYACSQGNMAVIEFLIEHCNPLCKDREGITPLHIACAKGHVDIVRYLVSKTSVSFDRPSAVLVDKYFNTLLHYACVCDSITLLHFLTTKCGMNPMCTTYNEVTPLHIACANGNITVVKHMISELNVSLNHVSRTDLTPLHYACISGNSELIEYLVDYCGCNRLVYSENGKLPLFFACYNCDIKTIEFLSRSCDKALFVNTNHKQTPFHVLCFIGNLDKIRHFATKYNITESDWACEGRESPLHFACVKGDVDIVRFLIDQCKANPTCVDGMNRMPLHYACIKGNLSVTEYLIEHCKVDYTSPADPFALTPLHNACRSGNFELVKYVFEKCDSFDEYYHQNLLHYACVSRNIEIIKYLIESHNVDPCIQDDIGAGLTPLHIASAKGLLDIVKYLVEKIGADPLTRSGKGTTSLHVACAFSNNLDMLKYFISKVSPSAISDTNYQNKSCLHFACENGNIDFVNILLQKFAFNPNSCDKNDLSPLHYAAMHGHLGVIKYLVESCNADPMCCGASCVTPLHVSCRNGHLEIVQYLIEECNVDPFHVSAKQSSALHFACFSSNIHLIEYLVQRLNGDVHCTDGQGIMPIQVACSSGHFKVTEYLIENYPISPVYFEHYHHKSLLHAAAQGRCFSLFKYIANKMKPFPIMLTGKRFIGVTPLHHACSSGCLPIVQYIVNDLKACINCADNNGVTPLHLACSKGNLDIVQFLVEKDVSIDVNCKDNNGRTPLHNACLNGHHHVVYFLLQVYKADACCIDNTGCTITHLSCRSGDLALISYVLHCGADPNQADDKGNLPLHFACTSGNLALVKFLIKHYCGLIKLCKNVNSETLLHNACLVGHKALIAYLIKQHGADPNHKDKDGVTPLYLACANGSIQVVQMLIEQFGADPFYKQNNQLTPLHVASENGSLELVKYLISNCNVSPFTVGRYSKNKDAKCTVLNAACASGNLSVVKYIVDSCKPIEPMLSLSINTTTTNKQDPDVVDSGGKLSKLPIHVFNPLYITCATQNLELLRFFVVECEIGRHGHQSGKYWDEALFSAVVEGCYDMVVFLIDHCKLNPAYCDDKGFTLLHAACLSGNHKLVQYFISKHHADPNSVTMHGDSPLHFACDIGSMVIVKYLVYQCNANIMCVNNNGRLPLHFASRKGFLRIVEFLLGKSTNQQQMLVPDAKQLTPLHFACMGGNIDLVNFLITKCNLNPSTKSFYNLIPLHLACFFHDHFDVVLSLVFKHNVNPLLKTSLNEMSTLHLSCLAGNLSISNFLLEYGADIDELDDEMMTPLRSGSESGNNYLVLNLLSIFKANPQLRCIKGLMPIHAACIAGHLQIVKALLPYYLESDLIHDTRLLEMACLKNHVDIIEFLVINGHGTSYVVENLQAMFRLACANNASKLVEYLYSSCTPEQITQIRILNKESGRTPLHLATDIDLVEFLANVFDPTLSNSNGFSPLQVACMRGNLPVVRFLIEKCNCDPKSITSLNSTLLHLASVNGHLDVLKYLIAEYNLDLYATNNNCGDSLLHNACKFGHFEVADYLLRNFAILAEIENNNGETPLFLASANGQLSTVHCLITQYQCDPMHCRNSGYTPLMIALKQHHEAVANYLIPYCENNHSKYISRMKRKETSLFLACINGYLEIAQMLIKEHNFDANCSRDRGIRPIHDASDKGNLEIVKFLVEKCNCQPDISRDFQGWTALHYACAKGHLSIVEYLITDATNKSDIILQDNKGFTSFHLAIVNDHEEIAKFLLPYIRNKPAAEGRNGNNPLHTACAKGYVEIVQELVTKLNYHPNCYRTSDSWSPLHIASRNGHANVVQYLIEQCHVDPDHCVDRNGLTPLHVACAYGRFDVMWRLVEDGHCDPKKQDTSWKQPLHHACINGHLGIARDLVIYRGCNPMCRDIFIATPLNYACHNGHFEIVKFLVTHCKCDPNHMQRNGHTPLSLAIEKCHLDIVEFLFCSGANFRNIYPPMVSRIRTLDGYSLRNRFSHVGNAVSVQSYVNICLVGDPGVGKSTLAQVITENAKGNIVFGGFREVSGVVLQTAGIIPRRLEHRELGNIILHDFAGQPEYYSSHISVLEDITGGLPIVFIMVFKLGCSLPYKWLDLLRNLSNKRKDTCYMYVLAVGSHADRFDVSEQVELGGKAQGELDRYFSENAKSLCFNNDDFVYLNCKLLGGDQLRKFSSKLAMTCEMVRQDTATMMPEPNDVMYCRMLYTLMETRGRVYYELKDIMTVIEENVAEYYLPTSEEKLKETALLLQRMGFIKCIESGENFWIIFKIEVLLTEVNGVLFAPAAFASYQAFASDTGVVSKSTISHLFSRANYNPDMIIQFLISRNLCERISSEIVSQTNLKPTVDDDGNEFYFFPALMKHDEQSHARSIRDMRADINPRFRFGWCLKAIKPYQFFTVRLLHLLILRLAYSHAIPRLDMNVPHQLGCHIWSEGIAWPSRDEVLNLVYMTDDSKAILFLSACRPGRESSMITERKVIIQDILTLWKKNCPLVEVNEYIIDPRQLNYPLDVDRNVTDLYWVRDVAKAIGDGKPSVFSCKPPGSKFIRLTELLQPEYKEGKQPQAHAKLSIFIREDNEGKPLNSYPELGEEDKITPYHKTMQRYIAVIFGNLSKPTSILEQFYSAGFLSQSTMERIGQEESDRVKCCVVVVELKKKLSNHEFTVEKCEKICEIIMDSDCDILVKRYAGEAARELKRWKCESNYYADQLQSTSLERLKMICSGMSVFNLH